MSEILTSGSVRGVDVFSMAEYCGTPQPKERSNREYKVRAILRLLDWSASENGGIWGRFVRFWLAGGTGQGL